MKRWISLLLVLTILFSFCGGISVAALADGQDESTTPVEESAQEELTLEEPEEEEAEAEEPEEEESEEEESETEDGFVEAAQSEEETAKEPGEETNAGEAGGQADAADEVNESAEAEEPVTASVPELRAAPLLGADRASSSSDLEDFLTNAEILGADQNEEGAYIVKPGTPYTIELTFQENANLQFDDTSMTYTMPTGLDATNDDPGQYHSIDITITHGGQEYTISGNKYRVENNVLTLTWNKDDPNYPEMSAVANLGFKLRFSGVFNEEATRIQFSDDIYKDIVIERDSTVRTTKDAAVVIDSNRVNYTATVESFGANRNVVVTDTITGTGLTLDPSSIQFTSTTGQPVSATGSVTGNSFSYTIPSMADQEVITITYSAIIDPSQLPMVNGKVVTQSGNTITAVSDDDPYGHSTHVEKEISYTPSIFKPYAHELVDQQDGTVKKLLWTVYVNGNSWGETPRVSAAGTVVTDTINELDRDIVTYSGTGITVRVYDANGGLVRTDEIPYGDLDEYSDFSWQYTIPESDAGHAYRYEITYTTDVETADLTLWREVGNVVVTNGGQEDQGYGAVTPDNGVIDINKTVTDIDKNSMEVTWETIVDVPSYGLPRAVVYDEYPTVTSSAGDTLVEHVIPSSLEISGLLSGENYTVDYSSSHNGKDAMAITFTNNGQPGLRGTGEPRQITITYKTEIDPTWLEDAKTDEGMVEHLNVVRLSHEGEVGDEEIAYIRPYSIEKYGEPVATRTVDGVTLPVYRYEITITGVDSDSITIEDEFDTSVLELYNGGEDAYYLFGGDQKDSLNAQGSAPVSHQDVAGGVQFTVTSSNQIRKQYDNTYYTYYKLVYYLTVKDAAALDELELQAIQAGGTAELTNTATWEGETDTTTVAYSYNGLDKELLTSEEDLHVDGSDVYAEFRITLNPSAQTLNNGNPLTMTDTVSNLSVDITSIQANPSAGVSWDMSGNTVTYTIPDATKVVITYRARVLFTDSGTLVTSFTNSAEMEGYYDIVHGEAERKTSGSGSGTVPSINLMKYEAGNMAKRLAGAKFQLLDANKKPVQGTMRNGVECDPYDLIFITDANGMITVEGNMGQDGWTIQEDTRYYLREIEAPPNYMLASFDYSFQVSSDGTTNYSEYIYHSGDTMTAKNYPGTDVQIKKEWTDGYENHESDTVTVKLQQKIGDGDWSDTIREEVKQADGSYAWVDTAGKVLTLNKDNDWRGVFSSLPLEVPDVLPVSDESEDVAVEYRIIETKVNDSDVDADAGTYDGGTVTIVKTSDTSYIYTITNSPSSGSLKIRKVVTENGSDVSSDLAKSRLAGDYTFTVYIDEECTIPLQKDGADVTVTLTIPEDGSPVTSEEITDIPAGTYYVKETSPATGNPSPVTNPVEVTVEAGKTGEETVIATVTNDFKYVEIDPQVNKAINTWPKNVSSFDFTLTAGDNDAGVTTPMPASGGENASATSISSPAVFGTITFEVPGTYNYTIKEIVPEDDDPETEGIQKDGVTYVETEYPVQIVVGVDSATGQLTTPEITYGEALDQASLTITNSYDAEGKAVLSAKKAANATLGDKTFRFQLLDEEGNVLQTSDPVKQGETATFDEIPYTMSDLDDAVSNAFTYKIREVIPEGATEENNYTLDGVKYDPKVVTTVVTVTDNGDGTLKVTYDGNETFTTPEFENEYDAEGKAVLSAKKAANATLGDKTFRFQLLDEEGNVLQTSDPVKQNETATFTEITYSLADLDGAASKEFTYKIREVIPDGATEENNYTLDGVKYDPKVVTTVVTVSDNGDGTLTVKYDGNESFTTPEFENEYDAEGKAEFSAKKAGNPTLGDKTFQFQLLDADDNVIETSTGVKQGETASFKAITYKLSDLEGEDSKTFTYKIREVIPDGATEENNYTVDGVIYDAHVETVEVKVEDNGDGTLKVTYDGNTEFTTPEFENKLMEYGSLKIRKSVTVNGEETTGTVADGTYTFNITGPNDYKNTVTIQIKNGVSNEVQLDNLVPGEYTVSEDTSKNPSDIALVGENDLKVTVEGGETTNVPTAEFTNNKTIETIEIPVEKRWVRTAGKSATIKLLADGKVIQQVVLNKENSWRHVFTDLPKIDSTDGHTIKYTVTEYPLSGYIFKITGDVIHGFIITNTPSDSPPTGDNTNLSSYLWLMMLSGLGLMGVLLAERKKPRRKRSGAHERGPKN